MSQPLTSKLRELIAAEITAAPETSNNQIASLVLKRDAVLFAAWLEERCLDMVRLERREIARRDVAGNDAPYQMFFPGFSSLAEAVPVKRGRVALRFATITDLRVSLQKSRNTPRAQKLHALITAMAPFASAHRGLTVERYCELAAAGDRPKVIKRESETTCDCGTCRTCKKREAMRKYRAGKAE